MERTNAIIRTSIIGIAANVLLSVIKLVIGRVANSVAITVDGMNNLKESLSSVITIIGAKVAVKEPDRKHPFGYGRIEYISSLVIGILIFYAGFQESLEAFERVLHPEEAGFSRSALLAIGAALIVKIVLGKYTHKKGEELESSALVASGHEALHGSVMSAATLVSAVIYFLGGVNLEAYIALVIALFILKGGIDIIRETLSVILGERVSPELAASVREAILTFPEVEGVYDLAIHNYGRDRVIGSAHIEVPDVLKASWIDNLQRSITRKVKKETGVDMLGVSVYAVNTGHKRAVSVREDVRDIVSGFDDVLSMHGFYLDDVDKAIKFEVITSFDVRDRKALRKQISEKVSEKYPDYEIDIAINYDITD